MAARYGTFSRSARNAFTSTFRSSTNGAHRYRSQSQSQSTHRRNFLRNEGAIFRRRLAETSIPLHSAIAAAKLVSHLSFSSRSAKSALPLGLGLFSSNGLGGGKMIMFSLRNLWNTISNGAPKVFIEKFFLSTIMDCGSLKS
ncbi:uncharacterized protein LOC131059736 isoform X2 [Cryptomeria japonica]|uniref:uncharacterized protein LOC131059736 isoform X2 n=1 Tax=Cryptomeria japonica TaxID=3369 RepID=UPI0025AB9EA7|nr:uncharacterized protein LOC131059736 isoform X2 [Cryptomeria japonica]XP_057848752.1 uncharacterized protein LOC131059736 isoform X2 [Cryptomeria japonica]